MPSDKLFLFLKAGRKGSRGLTPSSSTPAIAVSSWGGGQWFGVCKLYCTFHSLQHTPIVVTSVTKWRLYRSCYIPEILIISPPRMWWTLKNKQTTPPAKPKPTSVLDECTKTFPGLCSPRQQQQHLSPRAKINYTCPNLQQKGSHSRWGISAIHYAARHLHTCSWPLSFPCERWARKGAALRHDQAEVAPDCEAVRVICTATPPCTCTALPSSSCFSSSLTDTHKHHNIYKDSFRELQKESLGTFGRIGCKQCCAGWPVRSCGLCLQEMDKKWRHNWIESSCEFAESRQ